MKNKCELLAPGGDIASIKAAIAAGADAIYCGLNKFNARDRAANIDVPDLNGVIHLAHRHRCKVFLTLNILIVESEIPALVRLLNTLVNTKIDGVIVQDLGVFYLLSEYFPRLDIHASTQVNTHNKGQIHFLRTFGASRANLARELNIHEITALTAISHANHLATEVFVHGSYCLSFSGLCYMSSVLAGRSGNRGRCSQPCRDRYATTPAGKDFPLNLKDNSAYFDLKELAEAGVDSLKIEGRIKKFDYVYAVVDCWKKQLKRFEDEHRLSADNRALYTVFNRDFSNGFLKGDIHQGMFIDNPRDHSIKRLSEGHRYASREAMEADRTRYYEEKAANTARATAEIDRLSIARPALTIRISGELAAPLKVAVTTPDASFEVLSESPLTRISGKGKGQGLTHALLSERFKALGKSEYTLEPIDSASLQAGLFLPFKELSALKKSIALTLSGSQRPLAPIKVPALQRKPPSPVTPTLSVLISSPGDVPPCGESSADLFFELPSCLGHGVAELIALFSSHKNLMPWFPAVLIGDDYTAAVSFLHSMRPRLIVTNNTGIAHEAYANGIPWIAGPCLNLVNSFSLLCLKEKFNCRGAFISNEINKNQIRQIVPPADFTLCYSLYHPISLMTSRQCLFHQVTGCEKKRLDATCLYACEKSAPITNTKGVPLFITKTRGNYHGIYNHLHYLNTEIVTDLPDTFSRFLIDLRDIKTETKTKTDKPGLIRLFEDLLKGAPDAEAHLRQRIHPTTHAQYIKGL